MREIFLQTPWWVYAIFIVVVLAGLNSLRHRKIYVKQLLIIPTLLAIWNLAWLNERIHEHYHLLVYWLIGIVFGFFIGEKTVNHWVIRGDKNKQRIYLAPTYSTLILGLLIFAIRYSFEYSYLTHPELATSLYPQDAAVSGIFTGIFAGRTINIFRKFKIL
jgi:hypothetical protein